MHPKGFVGIPHALGSLILLLSVALAPAAGAKDTKKPVKVEVQLAQLYFPDETSPTRQSKGDVEIECVTLLSGVYAFPEVFALTDLDLAKIRQAWLKLRLSNEPTFDRSFKPFKTAEDWFPRDSEGHRWINTLGSPDGTAIYGFRIKLRNNTAHVIKLSDVRVYLKLPNHDDPIAPATELSVPMGRIARLERDFEDTRKKGFWSVDYQVGLCSIAFASKFPDWHAANAMEKEVPPGFSASGYIFFPVVNGDEAASVLFFEVPTKTDSLGTVTGRENFEFKFRKVMSPFWWDKSVNRWVAGQPPTPN